jgi:hypothetical protein
LQVLEKDSHKAPWKYINTISVEQLSFGLLPPTFQGTTQQHHLSIVSVQQQLAVQKLGRICSANMH